MKTLKMNGLAFTAILLFSTLGQARVTDFNKMINENIESQNQVHADIKGKIMGKTDIAPPQPLNIALGSEKKEVFSPTQKDFLRHKKELSRYQPSAKAQTERVAHEFQTTEQEF